MNDTLAETELAQLLSDAGDVAYRGKEEVIWALGLGWGLWLVLFGALFAGILLLGTAWLGWQCLGGYKPLKEPWRHPWRLTQFRVKLLCLEVAPHLLDIVTDVLWISAQVGAGRYVFASLSAASMAASAACTASFTEPDLPFLSGFAMNLLPIRLLDGAWQSWVVNKAQDAVAIRLVLEGLLEGAPQFLLQSYCGLLFGTYGNASSWQIARQGASLVLSVKSAATALVRLVGRVQLLPKRGSYVPEVRPGRLPGILLCWQMVDAGGRMLTIAVAAIALRPVDAAVTETRQLAFAAVLAADLSVTGILVLLCSAKRPDFWYWDILACFVPAVLSTPSLLQFPCFMPGPTQRRCRVYRALILTLHLAESAALCTWVWLYRWEQWQQEAVGEAVWRSGGSFALFHAMALLLTVASALVVALDEAALLLAAAPLLPAYLSWEDQDNVMMWAQAYKNPSVIGELEKLGCARRWSPAHKAVMAGSVEALSELDTPGVDLMAQDRDGRTPAHLAAQEGNIAALSKLHALGVDLNVMSVRGERPAQLAAQAGHAEALSELKARGADLDAQEGGGCTPAHRAAQAGKTAALSRLCTLGVDLNKKAVNGQTPAHEAARHGLWEALRELHAFGADLDAKDNSGRTPAHAAAEAGCAEALRELKAAGADLDARDIDKRTPVHLAAGSAEALRELATLGADFNVRDVCGWSLAHIAAEGKHAESLRELRAAGAELDAKDKNGWTPAHCAAQDKHAIYLLHASRGRLQPESGLDCLQCMFARPAIQPKSPIREYVSALRNGDSNCRRPRGGDALKALRELKSLGAKLDVKDDAGMTPAHWAVLDGMTDVLCELKAGGADLLAQDDEGWTPAHWAASAGQAETLRKLKELGANLDAKSKEGQTPARVAAARRQAEALQVLKELGHDGWGSA